MGLLQRFDNLNEHLHKTIEQPAFPLDLIDVHGASATNLKRLFGVVASRLATGERKLEPTRHPNPTSDNARLTTKFLIVDDSRNWEACTIILLRLFYLAPAVPESQSPFTSSPFVRTRQSVHSSVLTCPSKNQVLCPPPLCQE